VTVGIERAPGAVLRGVTRGARASKLRARSERRSSIRRWGGPARAVLGMLLLVGALFLFVFPTRAYLAQRDQIEEVRSDLGTLREQNERLAEESARLSDPDEIEKIARKQFHLVRPGERPFVVIPAPADDAPSSQESDGLVTPPDDTTGATTPVGVTD
jgi:cell division protein FtsB